MKRMIALITVAMFIFAFAAPGVSAKTNDDAVSRLNALGVVVGYGDGEFKPEQNITRAEYAAIVVQSLGLGEAAKYVTGNTKFSDVKADHWASGVINIAVSQGILAGYPDGTFKPAQNVSYNESITMVVRMLGYADTMENAVYPTSYVAKAAELQLLDSMVVADFTAPATRGNVFILADNALDTKMWGLVTTNNKGEKVYGEIGTLLVEKQKVTETADGLIEEAGPGFTGTPTDKISFKIGTAAVEYKWGLTTPASAFFGIHAKIYWKADGNDKKVVAIAPAGKLVSGKIDSITTVAAVYDKIKIFGQGEFTTATSFDYFGLPVAGMYVTLSLNDSGKIVSIIDKNYTDADVVKAVNTTDNKIEFKKISALDLKNVDAKNMEIIKGGKIISLADIKAGDVVSYYKNGTSYSIYVSDEVVTGKLDSAATVGSTSLKLVIDGKAKYSTEAGIFYSDDGGDTINARTTSVSTVGTKLVSKTVTAKLDAQGNLVQVIAGATADANASDAFIRQIYREGASGNYTNKIQVTKMDGTAVEYVIDNDDYTYSDFGSDPINSSQQIDINEDSTPDVTPMMVVKLTLDSTGKVEKIATISNGAVTAVNKDQDYITTGGVQKFADSDTKIVKVKKYGASDGDTDFVYEAEVVTWSAGESFAFDQLAAGKTLTAYYKDAKLKYVFVDSKADVASGLKPAILTGKAIAVGDGKWGITIIEPGKAALTYEVTAIAYDEQSEQSALVKNDVLLVKFNTAGTKITDIQDTDTPVVNKTVTDVNELATVIEVRWGTGDTEYTVISKNVKVFKKTTTGTVEGSLSDLSNGKVVDFYNYLDKDNKVKLAPADVVYDAIYIE